VLRRPPRPPELRQSARPPVLAARCPTIARHPPPDAPPAAPAASAAAAHLAAATRPPPSARRAASHERDARRLQTGRRASMQIETFYRAHFVKLLERRIF